MAGVREFVKGKASSFYSLQNVFHRRWMKSHEGFHFELTQRVAGFSWLFNLNLRPFGGRGLC